MACVSVLSELSLCTGHQVWQTKHSEFILPVASIWDSFVCVCLCVFLSMVFLLLNQHVAKERQLVCRPLVAAKTHQFLFAGFQSFTLWIPLKSSARIPRLLLVSYRRGPFARRGRSGRSICQTGKPDTGRHCTSHNSSKRWGCPSLSRGTSFNLHPVHIQLSSPVPGRRLCHVVSLWQFNLIVAIEHLWVAKGTISSYWIINSDNQWKLPMAEPQIRPLVALVCEPFIWMSLLCRSCCRSSATGRGGESI